MQPVDEYDETIKRLKRIAADLGQAEVARQLGVPRQTLHNWLSGNREPLARAWLKIQAFLKEQR